MLAFHGLLAGDQVCATYAGVMQNGHYSCFANSVDLERFGKFSPGDLILTRLIEHCCNAGFGGFDLGMGMERYKLSWCEEDPLFDSFVPLSPLGRLYTATTRNPLQSKSLVPGKSLSKAPVRFLTGARVRSRLRGAEDKAPPARRAALDFDDKGSINGPP